MATRRTGEQFCSAYSCNNSRRRCSSLSFVRFPKSEERWVSGILICDIIWPFNAQFACWEALRAPIWQSIVYRCTAAIMPMSPSNFCINAMLFFSKQGNGCRNAEERTCGGKLSIVLVHQLLILCWTFRRLRVHECSNSEQCGVKCSANLLSLLLV